MAIGDVFRWIDRQRDHERRVFDPRYLHFARGEDFRILDDLGGDVISLHHPVTAVEGCPEDVRSIFQRLVVGALHIVVDARIRIDVERKHLVGMDMGWNVICCRRH